MDRGHLDINDGKRYDNYISMYQHLKLSRINVVAVEESHEALLAQ